MDSLAAGNRRPFGRMAARVFNCTMIMRTQWLSPAPDARSLCSPSRDMAPGAVVAGSDLGTSVAMRPGQGLRRPHTPQFNAALRAPAAQNVNPDGLKRTAVLDCCLRPQVTRWRLRPRCDGLWGQRLRRPLGSGQRTRADGPPLTESLSGASNPHLAQALTFLRPCPLGTVSC